MGSINLRIDDELKARSYAALENVGVTPSEALRLMLEYIADNERLPFKQTLLSDEDAELVEIVKERLRNPKPVRVTLDELSLRLFWILTSAHKRNAQI
ncbi:type II toxin-antitoxin system RelB/DinJ family antitoxin [Escherichia coli]|nr:type II toxin-antitoxin system RelB/DinJ family antitoxin [Escherichia coli]